MTAEKAPGLDGLTREFYLKFFNEIKDILFKVYHICYQNEKLNPTARKGVIQLIPKKQKDKLLVKNWRPLTLLNLEYRILARVLVRCMESVIDKIIGPQQTSFIKNINISHNIIKTKEIIAHMNKSKQPAVIVSIDFENALIEWNTVQSRAV